MLYHVSRNGQMYGPYTLEDLRRYVASGNVLPTDMAKNDAMTEWMTVQQILGDIGTPGGPGYPPVAQAGSYVMMNTETYPDPPNLPWGLVLLFNILSCGLFIIVWNILIAAWMKRVQPASVALFYYIAVAAFSLSSGGVFFALRHHHVLQHHPYAGLLGIVGWVIKLVARFTLKADLERHYNGPEPLGLQLDSVLTFFFGGLYFQSQLNRIVEVKNAIRFREHDESSPMRSTRRILAASTAASVAAGVVLLLRFPPTQYSFYPRCPVKEYLHLECPGCGATRAVAALLQGHLAEALRLNALFVMLLPFLAGYALLCGYRAWTQETFRWPSLPKPIICAALALALLFTIARNLA